VSGGAEAIVIAQHLDLSGLCRPAPLARTAAALDALRHGDLLEVIATDNACVRDFKAWADATGQHFLEVSQLGNVFRFVIRRR
jgi:TusA-related sulfurtransferase